MVALGSLRHSTLTRTEAALLAGELKIPSWESENSRVHEKVSFHDTIWGFDLAGGLYYNAPLRVTKVKFGSRAHKAHIRPGDRLLRINDVDTSTLTLQEAHDIIVSSGLHIKLNVTSPEDEVDAYYCYQDPIVFDPKKERGRLEKDEKPKVHTRGSNLNLNWPWVNHKRFVYRESNCFMVPSRYEELHRDKFPNLPTLRYISDFETQQPVNGAVRVVNNMRNRKLFESTKPEKTGNKLNEYQADKLDDFTDSKVTEIVKESDKEDIIGKEMLVKSGDTNPIEESRSYSRLVSETEQTDSSDARSC